MVEKPHNTMNTSSFKNPSSLTLIHRWDEVIFLRSLTVGMKCNAKGHSPYFVNSPGIHLKIDLDYF
jgi:hypothetical protein